MTDAPRRVLYPGQLTADEGLVGMGYAHRWVRVSEDDVVPEAVHDLIDRGTQSVSPEAMAALERHLVETQAALEQATTAVALVQAVLRRVAVPATEETFVRMERALHVVRHRQLDVQVAQGEAWPAGQALLEALDTAVGEATAILHERWRQSQPVPAHAG